MKYAMSELLSISAHVKAMCSILICTVYIYIYIYEYNEIECMYAK